MLGPGVGCGGAKLDMPPPTNGVVGDVLVEVLGVDGSDTVGAGGGGGGVDSGAGGDGNAVGISEMEGNLGRPLGDGLPLRFSRAALSEYSRENKVDRLW